MREIFMSGSFLGLELHLVGALGPPWGHQVRLDIDKPGGPRLLLLVEAKDDQGRSGLGDGWPPSFAAAAWTVLFWTCSLRLSFLILLKSQGLLLTEAYA